MDRLADLAQQLSATLDELQAIAAQSDQRQLMAPLAWLDEANGWLRYEIARLAQPGIREPVPFSYIPANLRR